ncbi:MAG: hypothetical protein NTY35_12005 [Planctomycetota bacterium]|nr:hypothetical protein [Planctomycetota bacterium]
MAGSIQTVYLVCAAAGGTVLVAQTVMLLFGHGDDSGDAMHGDVGHDLGNAGSGEVHTSDSGMSLLSVRTIAAFLAFFGLAGWAGTRAGWDTLPTVGAALGSGFVMLLAVAWLFSMQKKLTAQGNLDPAGAVGMTARVYLRIPAANSGKGKIHVVVQGRTAELAAFTKHASVIDTGAEVRVVRQVTADTFEVEPIT